MIRISALNDIEEEDEDQLGPGGGFNATKEALESEAMAAYNRALRLQKQGLLQEASVEYLLLLESPFFDEYQKTETLVPEDGIMRSAELLKYSIYKNLAYLAEKDSNLNAAMGYYLEAVNVDSTDVSIWYKIGKLAEEIQNYPLARHAYETALQCNLNHAPSLDRLVTVLYVLDNYEVCLQYIARSLEKDMDFIKGLVFMQKIFSEHPYLRSWSMDIFKNCDPEIYSIEIEDEDFEQLMQEAQEKKKQRLDLTKPPELQIVHFNPPLTALTWKCLGECLIGLYDNVNHMIRKQAKSNTGPSNLSLACGVDLSRGISLVDPAVKASMVSICTPAALPTENGNFRPVSPSPLVELQSSINNSLPVTTPTPVFCPVFVDTPPPMTEVDFNLDLKKSGGRKRKAMWIPDDPEFKRRSTRVKNPVVKPKEPKETESLRCGHVLYKLLPTALQQTVTLVSENLMAVDDLVQDREPITNVEPGMSLTSNEGDDVQEFITSNQKNCGVIDLLNKYLITLAKRFHLSWPEGLTDVYIRAYRKLRKHIIYPNYLCNDDSDERTRDMAAMCLVQKELRMDKWLSNSANASHLPSSSSSPRKSPILGITSADFPGKYFTTDLNYLVGLSMFADKLGSFWLEFNTRVNWVRARFYLLHTDMETALDCFDQTFDHLDGIDEQGIRLVNCKVDNTISKKSVWKYLDSVKRCQSLEEVQKLSDNGDHEKVVDLLLDSFNLNKDLNIGQVERQEQIILLQKSLHSLKDYKRGLLWGELSLNEAIQKYKNAKSPTDKTDWEATMIEILICLQNCLNDGGRGILSNIPIGRLARFSQNLVSIIDLSFGTNDNALEMAINTVLPWILLYKVLKYQEEIESAAGTSVDDSETPPASIALLIVGHEYLGRRSWCMTSEGQFLLFSVDAMMEELRITDTSDDSHLFKEELDAALEQAFFCLYNHPNKKTRSKHLEEHCVPQILLTWPRCQAVFDFFKPKSMPEYDSYKTSTVSTELEFLLRRINSVVPLMENLDAAKEILDSYIGGDSNTLPTNCFSEETLAHCSVLKEVYYLLADYYFKNKEPMKAIKFYMYDLCINPNRFDSWAGLALARASKLEERLGAIYEEVVHDDLGLHELKPDAPIEKLAVTTLKCFKRALELDDSNSKLWIEYGSCAYMMHSHISRMKKQDLSSSLDKSDNGKQMLLTAQHCYRQAGIVETGSEEEWLQHYMLGKIAEKLDESPSIYLDHYVKAGEYLHGERARYPRKNISYYNPPHLAVEALEMYFRLHVSMIKYMVRHESQLESIPFELFETHAKKATESSLVKCQELHSRHEKRMDTQDVDENSSSNLPLPAKPAPVSAPGKTTSTRNDHNYFKQKMAGSSSSATEISSAAQVGLPLGGAASIFGSSQPWSNLISLPLYLPSSVAASYAACTLTAAYLGNLLTPTSGIPGLGFTIPMPNLSMGNMFDGRLSMGSRKTNEYKSRRKSDPTDRYSSHGRRHAEVTSQTSCEPIDLSIHHHSADNISESLVNSRSSRVEFNRNSAVTSEGMKMEAGDVLNQDLPVTSGESKVNIDPPPVTSGESKVNIDPPPVTSGESKVNIDPPPAPVKIDSEQDVPQNMNQSIGGVPDETLKSPKLLKVDADEPPSHREVMVDEPAATEMKEIGNVEKVDGSIVTKKRELTEFEALEVLEAKLNELERSLHEDSTPMEEDVLENGDKNRVDGDSKSDVKTEDVIDVKSEDGPMLVQTDDNLVVKRENVFELAEEGVLPYESVSNQVSTSNQVSVSTLDKNCTITETDVRSVQEGLVNISIDSSVKEEAGRSEEAAPLVKMDSSVKEEAGRSEEEAKLDMRNSSVKEEVDRSEEPAQLEKMDSSVKEEACRSEEPAQLEKMDSSVKEEACRSEEAAQSEKQESRNVDYKERYLQLMDSCMRALTLVLTRYPWHFKSIYRLAHIHFYSEHFKNIDHCKELLLGNSYNLESNNFTCAGLFHDRKQNNFFNGLWRIPAIDLDRCGSFSAHLNRALLLLFDVLRLTKDFKMLFHIHQQLARVPEVAAKKYLRDFDRDVLAQTAFDIGCDVLKSQLDAFVDDNKKINNEFLLQIYNIRQHIHKMNTKQLDVFLIRTYLLIHNAKESATTLEDVKRYCTSLLTTLRTTQVCKFDMVFDVFVVMHFPLPRSQVVEKVNPGIVSSACYSPPLIVTNVMVGSQAASQSRNEVLKPASDMAKTVATSLNKDAAIAASTSYKEATTVTTSNNIHERVASKTSDDNQNVASTNYKEVQTVLDSHCDVVREPVANLSRAENEMDDDDDDVEEIIDVSSEDCITTVNLSTSADEFEEMEASMTSNNQLGERCGFVSRHVTITRPKQGNPLNLSSSSAAKSAKSAASTSRNQSDLEDDAEEMEIELIVPPPAKKSHKSHSFYQPSAVMGRSKPSQMSSSHPIKYQHSVSVAASGKSLVHVGYKGSPGTGQTGISPNQTSSRLGQTTTTPQSGQIHTSPGPKSSHPYKIITSPGQSSSRQIQTSASSGHKKLQPGQIYTSSGYVISKSGQVLCRPATAQSIRHQFPPQTTKPCRSLLEKHLVAPNFPPKMVSLSSYRMSKPGEKLGQSTTEKVISRPTETVASRPMEMSRPKDKFVSRPAEKVVPRPTEKVVPRTTEKAPRVAGTSQFKPSSAIQSLRVQLNVQPGSIAPRKNVQITPSDSSSSDDDCVIILSEDSN